MSKLGLNSGYMAKYGLNPREFRPYFTVYPSSRPNTDTLHCLSEVCLRFIVAHRLWKKVTKTGIAL